LADSLAKATKNLEHGLLKVNNETKYDLLPWVSKKWPYVCKFVE
jgi:hypothetical protein